MTPINYRRRYLIAFSIAVALGVIFGLLNHAEAKAKAEDDIVITDPMVTVCRGIPAYSYWWYALFCDQILNGETLVEERLYLDKDNVLTVERIYKSGKRTEHTGTKVPK